MQRSCSSILDQAASPSAANCPEQQQQQQLLSGTAMPPALMDKALELLSNEDAAVTPRHYTQKELLEASASGSKGRCFSPPASWHKLASQLLSSSDDEDVTSRDAARTTDQQQGVSTAIRPANALLPCRLEQRFLQELSTGALQQQQQPCQHTQDLPGKDTSRSPPARRSRAAATPAQQHGQLLPGSAGTLQASPALQQRLAARARQLRLSEDLSQADAQAVLQPPGDHGASSRTYLAPAAQQGQRAAAGTIFHSSAGPREPAQRSDCKSTSSSSSTGTGSSKAHDLRMGPAFSTTQVHQSPEHAQQGRMHSVGSSASPAHGSAVQIPASSKASPGIGRHRVSDVSSSPRPIDTAAHVQSGDSHRSLLVRAAAAAAATYRAQNQQSNVGAWVPPRHAGMCADSPVLCGGSPMLRGAATEPRSVGTASNRERAHQRRSATAVAQDMPAQQHRRQSSCKTGDSSSAHGMRTLQERPCSAHAAFQTPAGHLCAAYAAPNAGQHAHASSNMQSAGAPTLHAASAPSRPAQPRSSRHVHAHSADFEQQQQQLRQGAAALQKVVAPWKLSAWLMKAGVRARPQRLVRRARAVNLSSESGDTATDSDSSNSSGSDGCSSVDRVSVGLRMVLLEASAWESVPI